MTTSPTLIISPWSASEPGEMETTSITPPASSSRGMRGLASTIQL